MATAVLSTPQKIRDVELTDWLARSSDEVRELIVVAAVPRRRVSLLRGAGGRMLPTDVASSGSRTEVLEELGSYLKDLLKTSPTLLKAAGALAVRASGRQAQELLGHPLVRSLKLSRKLLPPPRHRSER